MARWQNLKKTKPPINELVELKHMITGIGAPEREGWESVGNYKESGMFVVEQNACGTVDIKPPTHWRKLSK